MAKDLSDDLSSLKTSIKALLNIYAQAPFIIKRG